MRQQSPHPAPRSIDSPTTRLDIHIGPRAATVPASASLGEFESLHRLGHGDLLARIESVCIATGDLELSPELKKDLLDLLGELPALETVTLRPLGDPRALCMEDVTGLHACCERRSVGFAVDFTLDSGADAIAVLGGESTSLAPILECARRLRVAGVNVCWLVPALSHLVFRLESLFSLARDEGIDPVLILPSPADGPSVTVEADLDADRRQFLWDFITYRLLDEERELLSPPRVAFLEGLADDLKDSGERGCGRGRSMTVLRASRCDSAPGWVLSGEDRPAFEVAARDRVLTGSERFRPSQLERTLSGAVETAGVLWEGVRALCQWLTALITARFRARPTPASNDVLPRILAIGAYGGEHIGDAAILGGVLLRVHRSHGTTSAVLMSQRPNHTRHLIPMLDVPVSIEVDEHDQHRIAERMDDVDAVVFAGGPMMDIPKQLVKHLYAASLAYRRGKPFIVEGVGAGPFLLRVSEWVARRLVRTASSISVRTSTDAKTRLMAGLEPAIGRDPAFDYLATRPAQLTRFPAYDRSWVEHLLRDTEGRLKIGINIRPIRHVYTVAASGHDSAEHTRAIEADFERMFANALQRVHAEAPQPPCFVFYTMNGIQFGSSDLRSAYRLKRLLGDSIDFRVWEADPSLDGVVSLLRQVDVVIAMRFHAAIFALSQQRPVVGIDYRIGKVDKVHALLSDFGQGANCIRVDQFDEEWLCDRLTTLSAIR